MEGLPLGRIAALVLEFAVKYLPLSRTLMVYIYIYIYVLAIPGHALLWLNLGKWRRKKHRFRICLIE